MVERLRQRSAKPVLVGSTPTHASTYEFKRPNQDAFFYARNGRSRIVSAFRNIQEMTAVIIRVVEGHESEERLNTGLL